MGTSFSAIHHSCTDSNNVGKKKVFKIKTVSDKGILKCCNPFNLQAFARSLAFKNSLSSRLVTLFIFQGYFYEKEKFEF